LTSPHDAIISNRWRSPQANFNTRCDGTLLASGDILSLQAFERMLSEAVAEAATGEQKAALLNEAVDGVRRLPGENDRRLVVGDYVESLRRNLEGDE